MQVGLLDIDICGPSIPKMLGLEGEEIHQSNAGWSPVYVEDNLGVMSIGGCLQAYIIKRPGLSYQHCAAAHGVLRTRRMLPWVGVSSRRRASVGLLALEKSTPHSSMTGPLAQ